MQRARSGDGSVFLDTTKNAWVGVIDLGRDENGRRRRRKVFAATRPEAKQKLRQMRAEFDAGTLAVPNSMTVGDLLERWIDTVAPAKVAPTALATYRWAIELHISPGLGHHRLRALTPEHVDVFLEAKAVAGLSKSSLIRLRAVLGQALRWAEVDRSRSRRRRGARAPVAEALRRPAGHWSAEDEALAANAVGSSAHAR